MIQVLIAEDHGEVRDALRNLLEAQDDIEVIAYAVDGKDAVEQAVTHCPDVAVLDISMPGMDGIEAAQQIGKHCPNARTVMLTIHNSPEHVRRAQQVGAFGFVLKDSAGQELITAIRRVDAGGQYFSSKLTISDDF